MPARAGATPSPPGSRVPAPAASSPRAAATRCACSCSRRRTPGAGCAVLTGTLVAECAGETALGGRCSRSAWRSASGRTSGRRRRPALRARRAARRSPRVYLLGRRSSRVRGFLASAAQRLRAAALPEGLLAPGAAVAAAPAALFRLGALACFLAAFALPATPAAVLLVVFAQCSGRLIPFSPASVGAGAAILAATFEPVTGRRSPPHRSPRSSSARARC